MQDIFAKRLVPAAAVDNPEDAVPLAEAVLAGGLDVLEITFRTKGAAHVIADIVKACPSLHVGAGTVLTVDQMERAADAGIRFAVAPGSNEAVVRKAQERGILFAPGVMTPTEVETAMGWGCQILKLFPSSSLGGVKGVKALAGPYAHTGVTFIPTGGVNAANLRDFLSLPVVAAAGGSWMVARDLIRERNWAEITRITAEAVAIVNEM
jgi:2-dehydro-3-deoxyphosphogluconate aldolase/(4S)-4-hydroxy-2-oxoglutarate aldolase